MSSWDRRIDVVQQRFQVLNEFNDEAVLDRETGLVWERSPSTQTLAWSNARLFCAQKAVGGRGGWRLPAFNELASLVDPTITTPGVPRLPLGHPFQNVQAATYWSATVFANQPGFTMEVNFNFVLSNAPINVNDASIGGAPKHVWAVRGGSQGPDTY